jgi:hypothetical protein
MMSFQRFKYKWIVCFVVCILHTTQSIAQPPFLPPSDQFRKDRLEKVVLSEALIFTATSIGLYYLWYKKFPKKKFHTFNDGREWMQIDKIGHATTAYNISSMQYDLMRWCGVQRNDAILSATLTSMLYLSIIEVMDGCSKNWGFSGYDMLANFSGTALFAAQQYGWNEQRIGMKVSARMTPFAKENKRLLGNNWPSRLMKDYNGQTYWLSLNLRSFLPVNSSIPEWTNLSIGYAASGMTTAFPSNESSEKRYRRFFIAPDADLFRIRTENSLESAAYLGKFIKIPAPAIEFNSKRKFKLHVIYF